MSVLAPPLRGARELVEPALRAAVARLDPESCARSSYHLGWTDVDGRPTAGGGGKAVRPALALLSARAAGAAPEVGLPAAVAVELVHNFSLLHDDLMDGDAERRHRRTVWAQWGVPSAVLTGDALLTLAQQVLLAAPAPGAAAAALLLADATQELVRGQVEDLAFEVRPRVGVEECLAMAAGKTGALLAASAAAGAVLAGAPAQLVAALQEFGAELGLAFQLVDDLLGIWGDPQVTGKPVMSDLRSRKRSLPVVWAVASGTPAGRDLASWLNRPDGEDARPDDVQDAAPDEEELGRVAGLIEDAGGRRWAGEEAQRRAGRAEAALARVDLPPDVEDELRTLARFVVAREC